VNGKLYLTMLKTNGRTLSSYALGSALYLWLIIWIYPSIAGAKGFNEIIQKMPESLLKAFGYSHGFQDLNGFMAGEFYGLLFLIILSIYCIMMATQLIVRLVDRGAMAFLLASPTSRTQVAFTQAMVILTGLLLIVLMTIIGGLTGVEWLVNDVSLKTKPFIWLNVMGFLLFFVVSGYSFLFSCLFNDEKRALSMSALLTLLFYILDLVGKMSDKMEALRHFSIFSLFDAQAIALGTESLPLKAVGLLVSGILLYIIGILVFRKKDLII